MPPSRTERTSLGYGPKSISISMFISFLLVLFHFIIPVRTYFGCISLVLSGDPRPPMSMGSSGSMVPVPRGGGGGKRGIGREVELVCVG